MIASNDEQETSKWISDIGDRIFCAILTVSVFTAIFLAAMWVMAMPAIR